MTAHAPGPAPPEPGRRPAPAAAGSFSAPHHRWRQPATSSCAHSCLPVSLLSVRHQQCTHRPGVQPHTRHAGGASVDAAPHHAAIKRGQPPAAGRQLPSAPHLPPPQRQRLFTLGAPQRHGTARHAATEPCWHDSGPLCVLVGRRWAAGNRWRCASREVSAARLRRGSGDLPVTLCSLCSWACQVGEEPCSVLGWAEISIGVDGAQHGKRNRNSRRAVDTHTSSSPVRHRRGPQQPTTRHTRKQVPPAGGNMESTGGGGWARSGSSTAAAHAEPRPAPPRRTDPTLAKVGFQGREGRCLHGQCRGSPNERSPPRAWPNGAAQGEHPLSSGWAGLEPTAGASHQVPNTPMLVSLGGPLTVTVAPKPPVKGDSASSRAGRQEGARRVGHSLP